MKLKQSLINLLIFLLIGLFAVLFYLSLPFLSAEKINTLAKTEQNCDLHQKTCRAFFNQTQSVEFSITPKIIPVLKSLDLKVKLNHIQAQKVVMEIEGLNMDMGFNRVALIKQEDQSYQGKTILPSCMMEQMKWQARVLIQTKKGQLIAPFYFQTEK